MEFQFPGRWVGGITMILGPTLLLTGVLIRIQFDFFFPKQLVAFEEHPTLMITSYSIFLAANILMWPAIVMLSNIIGLQRPGWAMWGGILVISGLFARTFHAGIDHLSFQLVSVQSVELATKTVADSYGAFHIVQTLNPAILFGWIVLAVGAYLSGTLGLFRSIALGLMAVLMIGVLKGSTIDSVIATAGLCIALVPLGIKVLRDGPVPKIQTVLGWFLLIAGLIILFFLLGQAG